VSPETSHVQTDEEEKLELKMTWAFCQLLDVVHVAAACSRSTIRRIRCSSANNDDDDRLDINGVCGNDDCGTGEGNSDGDINNCGSNGDCGLGGNGENRVGASKDDDGRGGGDIRGNSEDEDDDNDWMRGKEVRRQDDGCVGRLR